jgi:hypothetical protein
MLLGQAHGLDGLEFPAGPRRLVAAAVRHDQRKKLFRNPGLVQFNSKRTLVDALSPA